MSSTVTVTGNLTRDPELKYTSGGKAMAKLAVAVSRKVGPEKEERISFFDVTCWDKLAENVAASCGKGCRVTVVGRLEQQTWDDKETGKQRSRVEIVADEVAVSLRWARAEVERTETDRTMRNTNTNHKTSSLLEEEPF